jgi:alpha-D-ribose 1-methylphosphonate 5-triphosphate synthase subunit PhnH
MERDISWSTVVPGQGADVALTVSSTEAWSSLAALAGAVLLGLAASGWAVWLAAGL